MSLDINTPKGQETLLQERRAAELYTRKYPGLHYIDTKKAREAAVDAMLVDKHSNEIVACVETKCREFSMKTFLRQFDCRWLVTFDKIRKGMDVAEALCVPLVGILYLVPDDIVVWKTIYDPDRGLLTPLKVERTETQRTVNGGSIIRANAFLDMDGAEQILGVGPA